tara:strand:+ start:64 stop:474 length:411 start_codon:yes stop_codon:yes gene_type:complete
MPIIKQSRRIDPLNLNKNVKIGLAFPLNETNMFTGTSDTKEQAKSNLLNLLFTHPGERIMQPTFGIGLKELVFEQNVNLESLKKQIQVQVNKFIPNIMLQKINAQTSENEHTISFFLNYMYVLDRSSDSIQLNFKY